MIETLRVLVALGLCLLAVMLRLEAERFGSAEYDEAGKDGRGPSVIRRVAWYAVGVGLVVAVLIVHPNPGDSLLVTFGDRTQTIVVGFAYAALGTAQAIGFAWLRYHRLRLPTVESYPGALVNALATAFLDEAVFRGILLGFLLGAGVEPRAAIIGQALIYALATRLGAPGRDPYMLLLVVLIGILGGWLTFATGGIGAAFLGHAVTRFSVFLTTGHAGQVALRGTEREDIERRRRTPDGWRIVGIRDNTRDR